MKLGRAKEHLDELNGIVARYLKDGPYAISAKDDLEHGVHIVRLELKPIDYRAAVLVGEVAYSLRSSLDNLAWQLILSAGRGTIQLDLDGI